jgi:hypothetical protein
VSRSGFDKVRAFSLRSFAHRVRRWCCCSQRCSCPVCQVSSQRSLQTPLRKASMELTLVGSQCIPAPLRRASTTSLFALSTEPDPIGQPCWRKRG